MARIALCVAVLATAVAGQTVLYQSLPNDWSHVWGTPYWTDNVTTGESSYGVVDQLNMVWWLAWASWGWSGAEKCNCTSQVTVKKKMLHIECDSSAGLGHQVP